MTTLNLPPPYTAEQLAALYPSNLELHQVQVIFRHGERTPVAPRFQNTGLQAFWPYCKSASLFTAPVLGPDGRWDDLAFRRRLETFGGKGEAVLAASTGSGKVTDDICLLGQLTDRGRETTLALGHRLRHLYVDQLGFLPSTLAPPEEYYLRSTSIVRALESLQQVFTGLYPASHRPTDVPPPVILARSLQEENLFPNEANCRRFAMLSRAFADVAAKRWNDSPEMALLNSKLGKWMPAGGKVAVDGHPRLSGIMDTVNATLAHGPETRLPGEFYDEDVRRIMNDFNVDEWYRGYAESVEFRRLGVGSLLGDIRDRATAVASGKSQVRLALMGCHDTTLAGLLASLGAFDQKWPPFTSAIAVETFRLKDHRRSFWGRVTGAGADEGWYVRLRYNEKPVVVSGCKKAGKHLEGNESFCTMEAFKEVVGKIAPTDWRAECMNNMDKKGLPKVEEVD
ncbi:histidine phosphatase superfamily [Tricharina praecox]|uniref:histidine phosphatase superfamily n=1 Tax=Tricharina praecox TaxID=43433 RepID=UPI0022200D42|nr:histidine phosphatase superfamily [Tricharina praecox]KAI5857050.1 histidine phosphatase superfamily [Tricharina praecox]